MKRGDIMKKGDISTLKEFAARLRKSLPEAQVWAFGSRVRGDSDQESDLDICVVVEQLDKKTRQIIRQTAWEIGFEYGLVLSTVKYSRDAFERGPCSASPLVKHILSEGVAA